MRCLRQCSRESKSITNTSQKIDLDSIRFSKKNSISISDSIIVTSLVTVYRWVNHMPLGSTQPGHPSVSKCNEYSWHLGSKWCTPQYMVAPHPHSISWCLFQHHPVLLLLLNVFDDAPYVDVWPTNHGCGQSRGGLVKREWVKMSTQWLSESFETVSYANVVR